MVFALLCVCFSGSFAFADSENASAANANEASCETDTIVGTVKIVCVFSRDTGLDQGPWRPAPETLSSAASCRRFRRPDRELAGKPWLPGRCPALYFP